MSTASSSSSPFPAPPNTPPALIPSQLHQPMVLHTSPPPPPPPASIAATNSASTSSGGGGGGGEEEGGEHRGGGGKVVSMAVSPPTPAPSPRPSEVGGPSLGFGFFGGEGRNEETAISSVLTTFNHLTPSARLSLLTSLLPLLKTPELLLLSHHISPRLKRDFLRDLPLEISLHVLSFVDSPRTLARASCVSRFWRRLLEDEWTWKEMCARHRFGGGVMSGMVLGNQAQAPPLILPSAGSTIEGGGGAGGGEFVPIPTGLDSPNATSFVSSSGMGGPSIPSATASTNMTFGTPQHQPASSNSGSSPSTSSSLGSASTMQSGLSSTSPSRFASLLPGSNHVTFNTNNASSSSSSTRGPNPTNNNPNSLLSTSPNATGSILTYPLPPNLPTSAPTQFSSIPSNTTDDDDDPMTDLTATQPSAPASGIAPLGFLSTVPFASSSSNQASSSSSGSNSRRRLVPRGLGIVGGFGTNARSVSSPLTRGESSHHGGGISKDWKQHSGKGKGKGKRRASVAEAEQEEEDEEGRFSYKRHFKRAYLTESNWLRGGRLLSTHTSTDDGVVTSLAVDDNHIVIGMANCKIHVFESESGTFLRTLVGHDLGVWCLTLVSAGGERKEAPTPDEDLVDDAMDYEEQQQQQPSSSSFYKASTRRSSTDAIVWDGGSSSSATGVGSRNYNNNNNNRSALSASAGPPPLGEAGAGSSSTFDHYPSQLNSSLSASSNPMSSTASLPATFANISDVPGMGSFLGSSSGSGGAGGGFGGGMGGGAPGGGGGGGGGRFRKPQSDVCGAAKGWGQEGAVIVSGGCDRDVRVWDAETGVCKHILRGHTSTIRCLKVLDGRPVAVSGSRDSTLRVWDIEKGVLLHLLSGHQHSVRCIEVAGNKVVSGSYDCTCRLWDLDTGECLQVFRGHYHQIYAVAFDGERVATGSLDSTVRVWSAQTGECLALLQGHTSLVGQLQLTNDILVTGGSDGRVIIFSLSTFECLHRLCAHDNSVTCLQFDDRFIVSGGNDGRVKLWDLRTGAFIRELSKPCEAVWRVTFKDDKCVVLCKRGGKTVMEVLTFRPFEDEL
ncbi:hypothetical protein BDY24DRAFT_413175 [Mrakia frigida]|uniref:F-box/WD repeat-containing protein n=1 Tax=Mrakia frigida TaxID=29902 RepID=UPI003FCC0061